MPEWILLQKEIRQETQIIKDGLHMERSYFGPHPLNNEDNNLWESVVNKYEEATKKVNSKIQKYNLVVPILNKQLFAFNLKKEAQKILVHGKCSEKTNYCLHKQSNQTIHKHERSSFLDMFNLFFKK